MTEIISWHPNQKDCLWIQETIWSVIQSFPVLRYLHVDAQFLQFTPTFKAFTTLESISISALEASSLYTCLSKLYASCSTLTSIAISDKSGRRRFTKANSVDQIFLGCSKNVLPGCLRRLCLDDCFVHIDKFTLPHLRQLTSLELICLQHAWGGDHYLYGHPRDIWSSFVGSGIQLQELVHNTTTNSMIDYLSSYSGLKKLKLSASSFVDASSSDEAATRFFNEVLSRHVETLESLSLKAYYEGEWCFTSRNAGVISQCTKLNHLLMSIISVETSRDSDSEEDDDEFDRNKVANPNVVSFCFQTEASLQHSSTPHLQKHLLDTVVQLPLMTHLSLTAADPEYSRGSGCGTGRIRHCWTTLEEIRMNVTNYRPPPSCSYLPEVEVIGNEMFEGVRDAIGQLGYVVKLKKPN